jgi:hypothetical protein
MPVKIVRLGNPPEMAAILRDLARAIEHLASATKARTQRAPELGRLSYLTGVVKIYGDGGGDEKRYSQAVCLGCDVKIIQGDPDAKHISTSYVERQNLTMRMGMRRFTRLTNGFSKKIENHAASIALHFMHYNFARVHMSLRVTPAMEAGVTDHVWSIEEIVSLTDRAR